MLTVSLTVSHPINAQAYWQIDASKELMSIFSGALIRISYFSQENYSWGVNSVMLKEMDLASQVIWNHKPRDFQNSQFYDFLVSWEIWRLKIAVVPWAGLNTQPQELCGQKEEMFLLAVCALENHWVPKTEKILAVQWHSLVSQHSMSQNNVFCYKWSFTQVEMS